VTEVPLELTGLELLTEARRTALCYWITTSCTASARTASTSTIYAYDIASATETTLFLSPSGYYLLGNVVRDPAGNLYGVALFRPSGVLRSTGSVEPDLPNANEARRPLPSGRKSNSAKD
jgi:hypothetical protein